MGVHKTQTVALALTFLECYHKYGEEYLNHIAQITGDGTWVSVVNVETKEQSEQWIHIHIHQTSHRSLNKCCLPKS
jgi:hypothetical protein